MQLPTFDILHKSFISNPLFKRTINHELLTMNKRQKRSAFTLIELLVVISILAVLTTFATVNYTQAKIKGRDARRKADLKSLKQALELFYHENGHYPPLIFDASDYSSNSSGSGTGQWIDDLGTKYINPQPKDPNQANSFNNFFAENSLTKLNLISPVYAGGGTGSTPDFVPYYNYYADSNGSRYVLWAVLENTNDPEKDSANCFMKPDAHFNYCLTND